MRCPTRRESNAGLGPRTNDFSPFPSISFSSLSLSFFFLSFHSSRHLCPISQHATRGTQHEGDSAKLFGINVKLVSMCSFAIAPSSPRNYNLMKIVTRRRLNGLGAGPAGHPVRSSCRSEHISPAVPFWDASCATFFHVAPKLRELGGLGEGGEGGHGARRGCFDGRGSR